MDSVIGVLIVVVLIGIPALAVIARVVGLFAGRQSIDKFIADHPDAAQIFLQGGKRFGNWTSIEVQSVNGEKPAVKLSGTQALTKGVLHSSNSVYVAPGEATLTVRHSRTRMGVVYNTVTKYTEWQTVRIKVEPHKTYTLSYDLDSRKYSLKRSENEIELPDVSNSITEDKQDEIAPTPVKKTMSASTETPNDTPVASPAAIVPNQFVAFFAKNKLFVDFVETLYPMLFLRARKQLKYDKQSGLAKTFATIGYLLTALAIAIVVVIGVVNLFRGIIGAFATDYSNNVVSYGQYINLTMSNNQQLLAKFFGAIVIIPLVLFQVVAWLAIIWIVSIIWQHAVNFLTNQPKLSRRIKANFLLLTRFSRINHLARQPLTVILAKIGGWIIILFCLTYLLALLADMTSNTVDWSTLFESIGVAIAVAIAFVIWWLIHKKITDKNRRLIGVLMIAIGALFGLSVILFSTGLAYWNRVIDPLGWVMNVMGYSNSTYYYLLSMVGRQTFMAAVLLILAGIFTLRPIKPQTEEDLDEDESPVATGATLNKTSEQLSARAQQAQVFAKKRADAFAKKMNKLNFRLINLVLIAIVVLLAGTTTYFAISYSSNSRKLSDETKTVNDTNKQVRDTDAQTEKLTGQAVNSSSSSSYAKAATINVDQNHMVYQLNNVSFQIPKSWTVYTNGQASGNCTEQFFADSIGQCSSGVSFLPGQKISTSFGASFTIDVYLFPNVGSKTAEQLLTAYGVDPTKNTSTDQITCSNSTTTSGNNSLRYCKYIEITGVFNVSKLYMIKQSGGSAALFIDDSYQSESSADDTTFTQFDSDVTSLASSVQFN